jgi:hypothetical protein
MPTKLKNLAVNWVNGMKINRNHFIQQENAFNDNLKDAYSLHLTKYNYGLLPLDVPSVASVNTDLTINNEQFLKVKIFQYRAISQGGARLEILEEHLIPEFKVDLNRELELGNEETNEEAFIILSIDIFNRQNFGEIISSEEPPRFPFTIPGYSIQVVKEKDITESTYQPFSFFIGKILINKGRIEIIDDYIPPCMKANSHIELISFLKETVQFFDKIEISLIGIIKKIKDKEQDTTLARSILTLSETLLAYITHNQLRLNWEIPDLPPVFMFEFLAISAHVMKNTIESNKDSDKEEMLNYFTNWSELKQGDFEKLLNYCVNFNYQHYNIRYSSEQFTQYMEIIALLFEKLNSLTYIGKKKETGIFVKEEKSKRSFLAD